MVTTTMPLGTVGGVHHVASVVEDAHASAAFSEQVLGWSRLSDVTVTDERATLMGGLLDASDATSFTTVFLRHPDADSGATVEYVHLSTPRGPGHLVLPGLHVTSYRTRDIDRGWSELLAAGADAVQPPIAFTVGPWRMRAATIRQPGGGLLELVQYGG